MAAAAYSPGVRRYIQARDCDSEAALAKLFRTAPPTSLSLRRFRNRQSQHAPLNGSHYERVHIHMDFLSRLQGPLTAHNGVSLLLYQMPDMRKTKAAATLRYVKRALLDDIVEQGNLDRCSSLVCFPGTVHIHHVFCSEQQGVSFPEPIERIFMRASSASIRYHTLYEGHYVIEDGNCGDRFRSVTTHPLLSL